MVLIKDYILTKSTMRGSSVITAMIVAIISTTIVSSYFELDLTQTPYYRENINYFAIILGGLMFGVGMMISDGCSNRHLIKFAQGDVNSLISLVFIAIFAYATTKGILANFFSPIITNPTLVEWSALIGNISMNVYLVVGLLLLLLAYIVKKVQRLPSLIDGVLIGLLVAVAWAVTGVMAKRVWKE